MTKSISEGLCDMCGHYVKLRQKAHIIAENQKSGINLLMLCPSCHMMFDTHIKPKVYKAMKQEGINLPESWKNSIYQQAADASNMKRKKKKTKSKNS